MPGQRGANITTCAAIFNNAALLNKCVIGPYYTDCLLLFLEDLHERLVPEVERGQVGHLSMYGITWDNVALHHSQCSHSLVWCPSEVDVPFCCPLLHWGVFLSLEMEGFWPSSTGPNECNACCMPRHLSWTLPGVDKAYQNILPKMPCQRRYQMWCGWEHVAKRRRPSRLVLCRF